MLKAKIKTTAVKDAKVLNVKDEELKKLIIQEIRVQLHMSVAEFSRSRYVKALDISESTLKNSLSSATTSYPIMKKLCAFLKLGSLSRKVEIIKRVSYSIEP